MNINLDQKTLDMCLKPINNIGSTTYRNICTNTSEVIPWGLADTFGYWVLITLGILFCLIFIGMFIKVIFEY